MNSWIRRATRARLEKLGYSSHRHFGSSIGIGNNVTRYLSDASAVGSISEKWLTILKALGGEVFVRWSDIPKANYWPVMDKDSLEAIHNDMQQARAELEQELEQVNKRLQELETRMVANDIDKLFDGENFEELEV